MASMRAKMRISSVLHNRRANQDQIEFSAVSASYGPNGESEDNTYARYTPFANLKMTITNPGLVGKLEEGQIFYVDFNEVTTGPAK